MVKVFNEILIILFNCSLTFLLTQTYITQSLREKLSRNDFLANLFSCPYCLGWWINLIVWTFVWAMKSKIAIFDNTWYFIPIRSLAYTYVGYALSMFIDRQITILLPPNELEDDVESDQDETNQTTAK